MNADDDTITSMPTTTTTTTSTITGDGDSYTITNTTPIAGVGGRLTTARKDLVGKLTNAALAPGLFLDRWVDPDDGEENLGFYRRVLPLKCDIITPEEAAKEEE